MHEVYDEDEDQCREDRAGKFSVNPGGDQDIRTEAGYRNKLQISWKSLKLWLKTEVTLEVAQVTAALTNLKPIWRESNRSPGSKMKRVRCLVIPIFLCSSESCTITWKKKMKKNSCLNRFILFQV